MDDKMQHLKELCKQLDNGYGWFVDGIMAKMKRYGTEERIDELIHAIESTPEITTDDVFEMTHYPEIPKVIIVDDDEL